MAEGENDRLPGDDLVPGPAATTVVSLSQLLLAPLDAILKAQTHAARSFLSFVMQLCFPPSGPEGRARGTGAGEVYVQEFDIPVQAGTGTVGQRVRIPALALVPVRPLSVQEATFALKMTVSHVGSHRPTRATAREAEPGKRPWYLVDDPISLRGVVASPGAADDRSASAIEITVKVGPAPVPAGLDKLLTSMTQRTTVEPAPDAPQGEPRPGS